MLARRTAAATLLVLALLPLRGAAAAPDKWEEFLADRTSLSTQLAPPIVDCFARRDSAIDPLSPIFHGCIDWHSAAHAAYSHHVLARRTGDETYLDLANAQIEPGGVSLVPAEEAYERAKGLDLPLTENPYGFGWFLLLAREREQLTGSTDMRAMADYAAGEMVRWFQARAAAGDARTYILNEAHPNYSWSLLNLDVWARYTGDPVLLGAVRDASLPLFATNLDTGCPATRDTSGNRTGFQPACLMRLAAASHIWGDHVRDWVLARLPADGLVVPPVTAPANCHAGGLNFTRAFALYQLFQVTGDTRYRDNYVDLVRYHVGRPDLYIDPSYAGNPGYLCYSHWVAQVGVRAISLSYEARPATPAVPPPATATSVGVGALRVEDGTLSVEGVAGFADQAAVTLGTDPAGDADVPATLGQDLRSAAAFTTTDGRLHLRAEITPFSTNRARAPRVGYGFAFCLTDAGCHEVVGWSTGTTGLGAEVEVWRCADPSCAPGGQTLTSIRGTAMFDLPGSTITAAVPLEALGADAGATLTPVSPAGGPVFTGLADRHTGGDRLAWSGAFRTGAREVSLAVGAPGQDPAAVDYAVTVGAGPLGGYAGEVDVSELSPGDYAVYARACFGEGNCGYGAAPLSL